MYTHLQHRVHILATPHDNRNTGIKPYMMQGTSWGDQNLAEELLLPRTYGIEHSFLHVSQGIAVEVSMHCPQLRCKHEDKVKLYPLLISFL